MTDPLHQFAERLVERQMRHGTATAVLDADVATSIAQELGLTDDEIAALVAEAKRAKVTAHTLRQGGNVDDAIVVLECAQAFFPLDLELRYALADALFAKARKDKDQNPLLARARALALSVVTDAPAHSDATALLTAIRNQETIKPSTPIVPILMALSSVALVVTAFLWWWR